MSQFLIPQTIVKENPKHEKEPPTETTTSLEISNPGKLSLKSLQEGLLFSVILITYGLLGCPNNNIDPEKHPSF